MKELSIEQKAKAYDEAIEVAQRFYNNSVAITKKGLEDIFPELKESERIKGAIIDHLKDNNLIEWAAWLEKQGENNMGISEATKQKLEDNLNKALEQETPESWNKFLDEQSEQKPVFEMKTPEESLGIDSDTYNKIVDECIYGEQKSSWSEEDEENLNWFEKFFRPESLITKCKDIPQDRYLWFKSLKDRVQPQPKQEWSEEDETVLNNLIYALANDRIGNNRDEYVDWLKSLKERYSWKPSIAQLNALSIASKGNAPDDIEAIVSLYNDLKKLREE